MDIARLYDYLQAHHGVITTEEAAARGLGPNQLRSLVRCGVLRPVVRGAYARADDGPDRRTIDRRNIVAVLRLQPARVAASHQSGAFLLDLPVLTSDLRRIHVTRVSGTAGTRSRPAFTVHRCPRPAAFGRVGGLPVVEPALAAVGTAVNAGVGSGIAVADAALRRGLATKGAMQEWLGRMRHTPGLAAATFVVERASASAESAAESRARLELVALGYRVVPQFVIVESDGGFVARVDFLLPDLGVVVEVDGAVKYDGVDGKVALVREKRREDRIRRLGYGVVRLVWDDLDHPERIGCLVEQAARTVSVARQTVVEGLRAHARRDGAGWDGQVLHRVAGSTPVSRSAPPRARNRDS